LLGVEVEGWAARDKVTVLEDERATAGLLGGDLKLNKAKAAGVNLSESIFACGNNVG
jgi:hypothetical protein